MRSRVRNAFEVLGMSALDLFASSLGVFVLVTFVLLPFYLRQPTLDAATAGAEAELAAIQRELALYRQRLTAAASASRDAEAALAAAQRRMSAAPVPEPEAAVAAPEPAPSVPKPKPGTIAIPALDLVIAIDATGSMRDELVELQAGILGIVRVLDRLSPSLAVGIVAYRDTGEEYVTRVHPLAPMNAGGLQRTLTFIDALNTKGGGDDPEALDEALVEAAKLSWRAGTLGRLIVIGDQPPRPAQQQKALDLAAAFRSAAPPGRNVAAIYVGEDGHPARLFFEALARAGGGDFRQHRGEMIESILLSVLHGARAE